MLALITLFELLVLHLGAFLPKRIYSPESIGSISPIIFNNVVFPHPLDPVIATISPFLISKLKS